MRCLVTLGELVIVTALIACGDGGGGDDADPSSASSGAGSGSGSGGGAPVFSEDDVKASFASFTTAGFTRISQAGAPTQHQIAPKVVIWVSDGAAADYRAIDPEDEDGTAGPFAVGTIVVKQNLDASGNPDGGATVLAKMDAGFNPDAGDWWWGRFDKQGKLPEKGVVSYCISCHEANGLERNDWLHGVTAENQIP